MALKKIEMLGEEPLELAYVKSYLRIDHNKDDGLIEGFMAAARSAIEAYTSRALIPQKLELTLNAGFAVARSDRTYLSGDKSRGEQGIELPRSPFMEMVGDPILETDYGQKTLTDYRVDSSGRATKIHFGPSAQAMLDGTGKIIIQFTAGYSADNLPDGLKQALLMITAQLYENRVPSNDNPGLVGEFSENVSLLLRPYQVKRLA